MSFLYGWCSFYKHKHFLCLSSLGCEVLLAGGVRGRLIRSWVINHSPPADPMQAMQPGQYLPAGSPCVVDRKYCPPCCCCWPGQLTGPGAGLARRLVQGSYLARRPVQEPALASWLVQGIVPGSLTGPGNGLARWSRFQHQLQNTRLNGLHLVFLHLSSRHPGFPSM